MILAAFEFLSAGARFLDQHSGTVQALCAVARRELRSFASSWEDAKAANGLASLESQADQLQARALQLSEVLRRSGDPASAQVALVKKLSGLARICLPFLNPEDYQEFTRLGDEIVDAIRKFANE